MAIFKCYSTKSLNFLNFTPRPGPSGSASLFLLACLPISISTCQSFTPLFFYFSCPLGTLCPPIQHLHINLKPSRLASQGAGNGEKVAKA